MRQRIKNTLTQFPWLVCERSGEICGYAYAGPYRTRTAYQWSTEVSVYIDLSARRMGIGRRLYSTLFEILRRQGYYNLIAGVTLPNDPSVRLHESFGFKQVGVNQNIGFKLGRWHDVGWWELQLQEHLNDPQPPVPFETLRRRSNVVSKHVIVHGFQNDG